jgi:hypothetical protein
MKNKEFILFVIFLIFKSLNCIRYSECSLFINNVNHTSTDVYFLNSNDSQLSIRYGMSNSRSFIEAYKINIICNYQNLNNNLITSKNISTVRGLVTINNCTFDEAFDLNIPNVDDHYHYMDFNFLFNTLFNEKRIKVSFDNSFIFISSKMIGISTICSNSFFIKNSKSKSTFAEIIEHFIEMVKNFEPTYLTILALILFIAFIIIGLIFYSVCKYFRHKRKNIFISNTLSRLLTTKRNKKKNNAENSEITKSIEGKAETVNETEINGFNTIDFSQLNDNHLQNIKLMPKVKFDKKQKAKTYSAYTSSSLNNTSNEFIQNGKNYTDNKIAENFELNTIGSRIGFVPNVIFQMKQIPSNIA